MMSPNLESKEKRLLQLDDMWRMEFVSSPVVSPDGRWALFAIYTPEARTGKFVSRIFKVPTAGGGASALLPEDPGSQTCPAFSLEGSLAYLSDRTGENQVWLIADLAAPAPRQLTTLRHGVTSFTWSPDGQRLAFSAPLFPDETLPQSLSEISAAERADFEWRRENMPVVVDKLMYKFDETFGVADGSCRQIGVISAEEGQAQILTSGESHHDAPVWSPDGSQLAFYGYPYGHNRATRKECFIMPAEGGVARQLTADSIYLGDSPLVFTPDGGSLLHTCIKKGEEEGFVLKLYRLSLTDGSDLCLFPEQEICHGIDPLSLGKSVYGATNPAFQLSPGENSVYFISGWQGFTHIYRLSLAAEPCIEQVTQGKISVRTFCLPVHGRLVYTRSDICSMDDLYCLDIVTGEERRLTFKNAWMTEITLPEPVEMWVNSKDGAVKIHGYVVPPPGPPEGKRCAGVLDIHGGPEAYYTAGFWFEFQMLAAAGMAAIYCDPRGSTGYGKEFAKDEHSWGDASYDDLMSFVDAALEKFPQIDPTRLGVTGGSYGGYMTNRILGKTERFKAAVNQRTFSNRATSYGTGDMGFISWNDNPPHFSEYMYERVRKSGVTKIDAMKTPLLLLHGEMDYRCTMEQAEQVFIPLKDRHPEIPLRMVIFPGENHGLTRTGKMHFQIAHLREMVDWFRQYLGDKEQ
jgi:dipeptidyl aminopeptidase/acylaminoacyl peptidase